MKSIINFSHELLADTVQKGDLVLDGTAGNGHDTLFLAGLIGPNGKVLSFDIQAEALDRTRSLLKENKSLQQVDLIHDNHAHLDRYLSQNDQIKAAIFNLGYLPKGDKTIITQAESTLKAIKLILDRLSTGGLLILVVYRGHPGGQEESEAVWNFSKELDQRKFKVLHYEFINQVNLPPYLIAIEKRPSKD